MKAKDRKLITAKSGTATLADVARVAGVSRQTAGAVLLGGRSNTRTSGETVRKILRAAQHLSYSPNQAARLLKGAKSRLVGVLNRIRSDDDPSHTLITRKLVEELTGHEFMASLAIYVEGGKSYEEMVKELTRLGLAGLVILDAEILKDRGLLQNLLELCPAAVFYPGGSPLPEVCGHAVDVNRSLAARLAVRHLIERGKKRIAVFDAPHPDGSAADRAGLTRMSGFRQEMQAQGRSPGLACIPKWWSPRSTDDVSGVRKAAGSAIDTLVVSQKADAIFSMALGPSVTVALAQELLKRGYRVPGDVAIITVRDYPIYEALKPSISAVKLHHDRIAAPMVAMLNEMVGDAGKIAARKKVLIDPELIAREST